MRLPVLAAFEIKKLFPIVTMVLQWRVNRLAAFLSASPGPEHDCQDDRPNDAPTDPRDVWVSRLPFEDLLMDGH
jgi:hypothetical protein